MDSLFKVIRSGMEIETPAFSLSEEDISSLLKTGLRQSILPVIYHGLKRMNIPAEMLKSFQLGISRDIYQYIRREQSLKHVRTGLDQAQVPYILLKGSVLRHLYPSPNLRTSCDIDVLVQEKDLDKAVEIMETFAGFHTLHKAYHDISMVDNNTHLELHFSIKENSENIDRLLVKAWDYAEPSGDGCRYQFTPEFQIFHVIAHMSYHFLHGGLGIRPFLDLWLLRNKTHFDEQMVRQMCSECGILTFYEECCTLSEVWLGGAEHTKITRTLESFCLSGGVFGTKKFQNAARQKEHRGLRYILNRAVPPLSEVNEFYKDETGKPHTYPYYIVKRWISWLGKGRRSDLRRQVHEILSTERNYIDSVDDLIRQLGL